MSDTFPVSTQAQRRLHEPMPGGVRTYARGSDQYSEDIRCDRWLAARSQIVGQTVQPRLHEPGPPPTHRRHRNPQSRSNFLVCQTRRAGQHDPRTQCQTLRRLSSYSPPLQLLEFLGCQLQQGFWPSGHHPTLLHDNQTQPQDTSKAPSHSFRPLFLQGLLERGVLGSNSSRPRIRRRTSRSR